MASILEMIQSVLGMLHTFIRFIPLGIYSFAYLSAAIFKDTKGDAYLTVDWNYKNEKKRPYVKYKHDDHVNIMGESSCSSCHVLNKEEGYMASFKEYNSTNWVNNFNPIKKKTCTQCHSEDQIDMECQACHLYHLKPSFKKDMQALKAEPIPITP